MITRTVVAAGAIAVAAIAYQPAPAHADAVIQFHFGVNPGGGVSIGSGGVGRRHRLSCGQAENIVEDHGYRRVRVEDCRGDVFTFRGRRHGDRYRIKINAWTGDITRVRPY